MNVRELIQQLQELEAQGHADLEVKFSYNYGDYWKTSVAEDVSEVEVQSVQYSTYHSMDKVMSVDDDEDRPQVPTGRVAVILC